MLSETDKDITIMKLRNELKQAEQIRWDAEKEVSTKSFIEDFVVNTSQYILLGQIRHGLMMVDMTYNFTTRLRSHRQLTRCGMIWFMFQCTNACELL